MKKGFSLVELIAVIALLGVIITLAAISVTAFKRNSEEGLKTQKISYIETGALRWGEAHLNELNSTTCYYALVEDLISAGYITGDNDDKSKLLIPGIVETTETFNTKCVCVKYEDTFAGKNISGYASSYHGTTNYQVTAAYGEGACN